MQSTGQTSTQARSLTSMQGWAMMYGTSFSAADGAGWNRLTRESIASYIGTVKAVWAPSPPPDALPPSLQLAAPVGAGHHSSPFLSWSRSYHAPCRPFACLRVGRFPGVCLLRWYGG